MKKLYPLLLICLVILFSCSSSNKKGAVMSDFTLDDKEEPKVHGILVDGFEVVEDWIPESGDGCTITTKAVPGKKGKAVEITYDLADTKQWIAVHNFYDFDPKKGGMFKFWIKGTGSVNNLEFKLVDVDGSNFLKTFAGMTKRKNWTPVVIPLKSLEYGWGGDKKLDMVTQVWIAITVNQAKKGVVVLDNLEFIPEK